MMFAVVIAARASMIDQLLGLRRVSWSDPEVVLGWTHQLPAWVWVLIILAACAVASWSYSRLHGARALRGLLATLRALVIVLLAALLAGPVLIRPDEQVEQDWLLVLVDRSASMKILDTFAVGTDEPVSRDAMLKAALLSQAHVFGPQGLGRGRRIEWMGFGERAYAIDPPVSSGAWEDPAGQGTAIRTAIEQSLKRAAGKPISGIVLISDGRSPEATGANLVRWLQQQAVSVFAVPVGAGQLPLDLGIGQVDAPERAFSGDIVPVSVTVDRFGQTEVAPRDVLVRLIDTDSGRVLDQRTLAGGPLSRPIHLTGRSSKVGQVKWQVEVAHEPADGDPAERRELVTSNNRRPVLVELIDRPIRVLYVEGYPRWEYRYLKNLLIREQSITASVLLLSADRAFTQEGDLPITRAPANAEEMAGYDVVILGDVPPDYFTASQLLLLRDHVALGGAGLLWIGGERFTPRAYDTTPLRDLLPMRRPAVVERVVRDEDRVQLQPTPLAKRLSILQLREPGDAEAETQWPADLPPLRWVQDLRALKPTAEVLADAPSVGPGAGASELALLVRLRYGAGQSLYVATDETWRWRYGRGELYFEQFWVQLVRMLGRGRVQQSGERARLTVSHRRVGVGQSVVVKLAVADPVLRDRQLPKVAVTVWAAPQIDGAAVDDIELWPQDRVDPLEATGRQLHSAVWRPTTPGQLVLRVTEPALDDLELIQRVEVIAAGDELRQVETDHGRLATLAADTGGQVVGLDRMADLLDLVPNRARKTPNDVRESVGDSVLAFMLVLALLTAEWILRRVLRLA